MKLIRTSLCAVLVGVGLAGCGSSVKLDEGAPVVNAKPSTAGGAGAAGSGATTSQSQVATVDATKLEASAASRFGRVVYFDFDSYAIKDEFRPLIEAYGRVLSTNKSKKMVVEGNTDERGGREYNLALGQRRAEAVVKALELLGAGNSQLEAVSFGEERPAVDGHDEAAWAKNRRAELKDR
ncbi:MAG: peptidoglycan-associated lipoprotein Pal [Burkholderiaceae bacterium]|nr:MAG: peptidoglycan-associated lipoprotein Pal [Burkholderiaceae bacterium]MBE7426872.1 peptidoglycan-associated lipoprotein Pal [Ideonella sp.]MCC7286193.1 peptidoglycan-associated lipoprotein Pal [Burkholderiaceae bacterium]